LYELKGALKERKIWHRKGEKKYTELNYLWEEKGKERWKKGVKG